MYKKIFLILLIFLMCLYVFASASYQHIEEHTVISENYEEPVLSSETIISDDGIFLDLEKYKFTTKASPEILEFWNGVPDEVLSYSTADLFEYFMQSKFMGRQVMTCYSAPPETPLDFSCSEAFRELISRKDFVEVLEDYAKKTFSDLSDSIEITKLEKILEQPSVRALVLSAEIKDANYEYGDVCDICRKITNTEWISLP